MLLHILKAVKHENTNFLWQDIGWEVSKSLCVEYRFVSIEVNVNGNQCIDLEVEA